MKILASILVLGLVAGCSSGTRITADDLAWLQPGVTTESELVSHFGDPDWRQERTAIGEVFGYDYSRAFPYFLKSSQGHVFFVLENGIVTSWTIDPEGLERVHSSGDYSTPQMPAPEPPASEPSDAESSDSD